MLTAEIPMSIAMLASRRVAGMEFAMFTIHVAMIIAMPGAWAVAVPASMLGPMIALHIAMKFAMIPPSGIRRMKVAMILPDIAMVFAVTTIRTIVAVARLLNLLDARGLFDLLHLTLGAWRALDSFEPLRAFGALQPLRTAFLHSRRIVGLGAFGTTLGTLGAAFVKIVLAVAILRHGRSRHHRPGHQNWNQKPTHRSTPPP